MTSDKIDRERHEELVTSTLLSSREAELYLLKTQGGMTLGQAAEEMGISTGTVKGKWGRIKKKIRVAKEEAETAEATANLST